MWRYSEDQESRSSSSRSILYDSSDGCSEDPEEVLDPKKDELKAGNQVQVKQEPNIQDTKPRARSHTVGEPRAKLLSL